MCLQPALLVLASSLLLVTSNVSRAYWTNVLYEGVVRFFNIPYFPFCPFSHRSLFISHRDSQFTFLTIVVASRRQLLIHISNCALDYTCHHSRRQGAACIHSRVTIKEISSICRGL